MRLDSTLLAALTALSLGACAAETDASTSSTGGEDPCRADQGQGRPQQGNEGPVGSSVAVGESDAPPRPPADPCPPCGMG